MTDRIASELDHAVRLRQEDPSDSPYPGTVGEAAAEVVAWIRLMETGPAAHLGREVLARLAAPEAPSPLVMGEDEAAEHQASVPPLQEDQDVFTAARDAVRAWQSGSWRIGAGGDELMGALLDALEQHYWNRCLHAAVEEAKRLAGPGATVGDVSKYLPDGLVQPYFEQAIRRYAAANGIDPDQEV